MEKIKRKGLVIFILGLLSAIGPFSIDMYLPGFKDIAESLDSTVSYIGLSISSYFIGISIGQLFYGPLLDRYGRKPLIYFGLVLYIVASVICAMVLEADQLIAMRFFQALGGCVGMVASRALIRDLFPVEENAKIFSYLMLVIAISPLVAPTFGGFITAYFGWEAIFVCLALIATATLFGVIIWVPAGNEPDTELSLKPRPIIKKYIQVSKVPKFYTYALVSAISSSGLYAYIAGSPTLFYDVFEVSKKQYVIIFAVIALGMTFANQINTFLLRRFSSERISFTALLFQIGAGLVLVFSTYFGWLNLYTTIASIWIYMATQGFVYPNTSALSIAPFRRSAGTASALMGAVQLGIGAITTALVSATTTDSALPMASAILICGTTSTLILVAGRKRIEQNPYLEEAYSRPKTV